MAPVALAQALQPGVVDLDVPRAGVQRPRRGGEQVDRDRAHRRDEPRQVGRGPLGDLGLRQLQPLGQLGDLVAELGAVLDRLDDVAGDLVAVAEERALGAVDGHRGLPGHELGKAGVGPRRRAPVPAAQLADRGRAARDDPRAVGLPPDDPRLDPCGRAPVGQRPRVQRPHVRPPGAAPPVAFAGQPRHAHGQDLDVVGEPGERPGQRLPAYGEHRLRRHPVGAQPLPDEPPLDLADGIDQHHGPVHPPIVAHGGTPVTA